MAGEEAVQITATAAQKAMEISVELMKAIVIPTLKTVGGLGKKGVEKVAESIKEAAKSGNVPRNTMLLEAAQSGSAILSSNNQFAEDVSRIAVRAKQEGIPIHIIGSGGKQSIEFLERDKAIMQNIMQETIAGNIKSNSSEYMHFTVNENNIAPLKAMFEKNGVECCFSTSNGKTFCSYHSYEAEKVNLIKQDFKAMRNELDYELKTERSAGGLGTLTDAKTGKSVDLSQFGGNVRQYQVVNVLQKELGYSKERATLAANKVCDDLGLDPKEFFAHTEQLDEFKSLKTNIRFESDDRLLQDFSFSEVYFRGGESPHILLSHSDSDTAARTSELKQQIDQLENAAPTAEDYDRIIEGMKENGVTFPTYSEKNTEIIERELPDVKQVAGKAFWEKQGFSINKNAKGVEVVAPQMDENGKPVLDVNGKQTFTTVTVYDISQTNAFEKDAKPKLDDLRRAYGTEKLNTATIIVTPDNMSAADIKEMCISQLGMSEQQADKAVEKALKINNQIKSQYKEIAVDRTTGISQQVEIERTSKSSFTLTIGATKKQYDLKDAKLSEKLQKDLGISSDKAARIISKTQKQSSFVNNFERFAKRKSDKPKQVKELLQTEKPNSKGARK